MTVWMSILRRGVKYHHIQQAHPHWTVCGKYIGKVMDSDEPVKFADRGSVLPLIRAVDDYASHVCDKCEVA